MFLFCIITYDCYFILSRFNHSQFLLVCTSNMSIRQCLERRLIVSWYWVSFITEHEHHSLCPSILSTNAHYNNNEPRINWRQNIHYKKQNQNMWDRCRAYLSSPFFTFQTILLIIIILYWLILSCHIQKLPYDLLLTTWLKRLQIFCDTLTHLTLLPPFLIISVTTADNTTVQNCHHQKVR